MKFLIAVLALATVVSARGAGNIVFNERHGSHRQTLHTHVGSRGGQEQSAQVAYVQAQPVQQAQIAYVQARPVQAQVVYVQARPVVQQARVQLVAIAQQQQQQHSGPIHAAVQSTRSVEFVDVPSTGAAAQPQSIIIGPSVQPLDFEFQSQSSPISVRQTHIPGTPNQPQESSHTDEPDILRQTIVKPIIHEVTEAIQPVRRISQEVRPVQETINQLITRGEQRQVQQAQRQQVVQAIPVQVVQAAQPVQVVQAAQPVQTIQIQPAQLQTIQLQAEPQSIGNIQLVGNLQGLQGLQSSGLSGSLQGVQGVQDLQDLQIIRRK